MTIPSLIDKWWNERRWDLLAMLFNGMWNMRRSYYLKRNRNAVARIKIEFCRLFPSQYPTLMSGITWIDEQIAKYVHHLGVAALIDDMRACAKKYKPRSVIYFLVRKDGAASRWELLLIDKLQREAKKEKEAWAELAGEIKGIGLERIAVPEWVKKVRKEWFRLERETKRLHGTAYIEAIRQMKAIEARLENQGFSLRH